MLFFDNKITKDVHILIPGTCDCVTLPGKKGFAAGIKGPQLSKRATGVLAKGKQKGQS